MNFAHTVKSLIIFTLIATNAVIAQFDDNFTRTDSSTIGNDWTETNSSTGDLDAQIVNNEVSWVRTGSTDSAVNSTIEHTFDQASDVSVKLKMPIIGTDGPSLEFSIFDESNNKISIVLAEKFGTSGQVVRIYLNGVEKATRNVSSYIDYNKYKFTISDSGQVTVIFNTSAQWESPHGTFNYAIKAQVRFARWWQWNQAFADEFVANDAPEDCQCDPNIVEIKKLSEVCSRDSFDSSDSSTVDGWTETSAGNSGGGGSLPTSEIASNEVLFKRNGWGSDAYSKIAKSFASSQYIDNVSVDLALDTSATAGSNVVYTELSVTGTNRNVSARIFVDTSDSTKLGIGIYDNGTWIWGQTANDGDYNNLRFTNEIVNGEEQTRFYFNSNLLWTSNDGGLGMITNATISAYWKTWVDSTQHYADNFICSKSISTSNDSFNRSDNTSLDNNWTETATGNSGGGGSLPTSEIANNEVLFKRNGWGSDAYAKIAKSFASSQNIDDVSVDLALDTNATAGSNVVYTELLVTGTNRNVSARIFVDTSDSTKLGIGIYDDGTWIWGQTANDGDYNNLRFTNEIVNGEEQTRFYFNSNLLWTSNDGGLGMITNTTISAYWKTWIGSAQHYADNFISTSKALLDENEATYITPAQKEFLIFKDNTELIMIEFLINSSEEGAILVDCGDVMPRLLEYEIGKTWYRLRIPHSTSETILITWDDSNNSVDWCDVRLLTKSEVPTTFTADETINISLDISGENSDATTEVPFGVMCNWWESGLVDAIGNSSIATELIDLFSKYGVDALRYPGGTGTYGYPMVSDAIQTYIEGGLGLYAYGLYNDPLVWNNAEDYLDFCIDASITSWFEINPGFWFDSTNLDVYKTIPMKNDDPNMTSYLTQAVNDAVDFADIVHYKNANIIWEIGNEDYCYYSGSDYADLCEAFVESIKNDYPNDKFAVCGDSNSWSDWNWHNDVVDTLETSNISDVDYSSNHLYLTGVGYWDTDGWHAYPWNNARDMANSTVSAWPQIKAQYINPVSNFTDAGFNTKSAITEFNILGPGQYIDERIEHSFGRALGEAQVICSILNDLGSCFFVHDLVRNDPNSTWFARLDYYPENELGKMYYPFAEFIADSISSNHGHGNIVYHSTFNGVCISKHTDYIYITVINRDALYKNVSIDLDGVTFDSNVATSINQLISEDPDCFYFNYIENEATQSAPTNGIVNIQAYPYSITAAKVAIQ